MPATSKEKPIDVVDLCEKYEGCPAKLVLGKIFREFGGAYDVQVNYYKGNSVKRFDRSERVYIMAENTMGQISKDLGGKFKINRKTGSIIVFLSE